MHLHITSHHISHMPASSYVGHAHGMNSFACSRSYLRSLSRMGMPQP